MGNYFNYFYFIYQMKFALLFAAVVMAQDDAAKKDDAAAAKTVVLAKENEKCDSEVADKGCAEGLRCGHSKAAEKKEDADAKKDDAKKDDAAAGDAKKDEAKAADAGDAKAAEGGDAKAADAKKDDAKAADAKKDVYVPKKQGKCIKSDKCDTTVDALEWECSATKLGAGVLAALAVAASL